MALCTFSAFPRNMASMKKILKFSSAVFLIYLIIYFTSYDNELTKANIIDQHMNGRNKQVNTDLFFNAHSYAMWKSVRLNPEDYTGNAHHRRYGDPLDLYSLPSQTSDQPDKVGHWIFDQSPNELVDCRGLFMGNGHVSEKTQTDLTSSMRTKFRSALHLANKSCDQLVRKLGYVTTPLTQTEASFPIAYSVLVFKDVEQFEILLRSIYRPQNVYCVHVDKKSSSAFRADVETLAGCFDNVFITSKSTDVIWGGFSVLEPEITCLKELWMNKKKWKYFINLTGQEIPLRTNYELVKILSSFDGANNVEVVKLPRNRLAGPPPLDVTAQKGAVHVVLSRSFVDFLLHNEAAIDIYEWSRTVKHSSEIFFNTLNYNRKLAAPGSYKGEARTTKDTNPFIVRLKNWETESSCHGKYHRSICIFGRKDLPLLATREELFANKLHFGYYPEVLVCMQELLTNRTADEYNGHLEFNVSYYATRDFVKNKF